MHVAGDGVGDGPLDLLRRSSDRRGRTPLDCAGHAPARDRRDQDQPLRRELLETLRDRDGTVREILDDDLRAEVAEPLDCDATEVEVALIELPDSTDENARASQRRTRRC